MLTAVCVLLTRLEEAMTPATKIPMIKIATESSIKEKARIFLFGMRRKNRLVERFAAV